MESKTCGASAESSGPGMITLPPPASCVSSTEARFVRWGMPSLVVAKFIPGFSTVAPPIAGSLRMALPGFLLAAALTRLIGTLPLLGPMFEDASGRKLEAQPAEFFKRP